uniref:Uncharacterized protein n=1 Tax=Rhizophora mucronata TaxID=61149 RepID=A0A2P2PQ14_RHIMU
MPPEDSLHSVSLMLLSTNFLAIELALIEVCTIDCNN